MKLNLRRTFHNFVDLEIKNDEYADLSPFVDAL